jgi:hypothetical protein
MYARTPRPLARGGAKYRGGTGNAAMRAAIPILVESVLERLAGLELGLL